MKSISSLLAGLLISICLFWLMQAMMHASREQKMPEKPVLLSFVKPALTPAAQPAASKPAPPSPPTPPKPEPETKPAPPEKPTPVPPKPKPKPLPKKPEPKPVKPEIKPAPVEIPKPAVAPTVSKPVTAPTVTSPATATQVSKPKAATEQTGGVNSNLKPIERVEASYPPRALDRHIEGWVKVEFTVTESGTVENAKVVGSEPPDTFDEAALEAIEQWRFKEKIVDGHAVSQRASQVLKFTIAE